VADRLLDQRTQPRLAAVERPLPAREPILGSPVPDGCMPVLAALGHAPKPPVQDGHHAAGIQHVTQPRKLDQFLLVAAPRPAAVTLQQVTVNGGHRKALGGVGVALGVV